MPQPTRGGQDSCQLMGVLRLDFPVCFRVWRSKAACRGLWYPVRGRNALRRLLFLPGLASLTLTTPSSGVEQIITDRNVDSSNPERRDERMEASQCVIDRSTRPASHLTLPARRLLRFLFFQVGDWTQELFRLSLGDLCMPIWITAAQPSVLEKSIFFDNGEPTD